MAGQIQLIDGIAMGLDADTLQLLLAYQEHTAARMPHYGYTLPHLGHTRAEIHIKCAAPGDRRMVVAYVLYKRTGGPFVSIPKDQTLQFWHPKCQSSGLEQQAIDILESTS